MKKGKKCLAAVLIGAVVLSMAGCSLQNADLPPWLEQEVCQHVFDDGETLQEATCIQDGKIGQSCTLCGKTKIVVEKAHGHTALESEEIPATPASPGMTAGTYCGICGETLSGRVKIPQISTGGNTSVWDFDPDWLQ